MDNTAWEAEIQQQDIEWEEQPSILVIDDDHFYAVLLKHVLSYYGAQVCIASSCDEAVKIFTIKPFSLVFLDIGLPDGNGLQLIKIIKIMQPNARIVTMTSHNSKDLERYARDQRVVYHLLKPFSTKEIRSIYEHIVEKIGCVKTQGQQAIRAEGFENMNKGGEHA